MMDFAASLKTIISRASLLGALGIFISTGSAAAIAGETPLPLKVVPELINVGEIAAGSSMTFDLIISNSSGCAVKLVYIFAECDCSLSMVDHGKVPAGGSFVLHANLQASTTGSDVIDETITILTDLGFQKELKIPVRAIITQSKPATSEVLPGG